MSPARVPAAVLATLLVAILSSACLDQASKAVVRKADDRCTPAIAYGGANEPAIPASFPRDFPVYPGASFAAATHTGKVVEVTWTATAAPGALRAFYEKQLQSGDWRLFGDQRIDPCGAYWHVERRSDSHYGGLVSVYSGPGDAGTAVIHAVIGNK